ncbi:MAG: RHS repeat-associated core domain-containing protein [Bacteroidota bacterium]|nr:RHS repeat-associated core domain-containing protein [Bacteroidota bacterium]
MERAIYNRKEQVWRTADKLGNLYQSKEKNDRQYQSSQLQYDGKWYYYYDKEGKLIHKSLTKLHRESNAQKWSLGAWQYAWDAKGMLKAVQRPDGSVITFKYDAFGRRISKSYHRREFLYIWDKNVPLHEVQKEELCEDNVITWIFEGFTPTAKLINGKAYSIISDHIGTPILAVDTNGVKVWERELDIYGRVRKEFTSDDVVNRRSGFMPFLYAGQYYDRETDLAYNRFRYYSPDTGAYISQDPIGLVGNNPTIYGYVFDGNTEVDVLGLNADDIVMRGGTKPLVEGSGVIKVDDKLFGISVNVLSGKTKEELSSTIPHNQIATTTRGQIEAVGATIIPDPSKFNPYHALINNIKEEDAEKLFSEKEKNPTPKEQRCLKK